MDTIVTNVTIVSIFLQELALVVTKDFAASVGFMAPHDAVGIAVCPYNDQKIVVCAEIHHLREIPWDNTVIQDVKVGRDYDNPCGVSSFSVFHKATKRSLSERWGTEITVIGAGPCGLRTAIELRLLGFHVIVLEQRKDFTRNNVLHLWSFVIEDLKRLGMKVMFPKFCIGSMNHISIRRLQNILLKIALVLGVEVYLGTSFLSLLPPRDSISKWSVSTSPDLCICTDVLICAQGKHVTVQEFDRREFRGKLAIAITANFVNNKTSAEALVEEISGIAYVYKQDFFNALYDDLGIALENFVYYKDETHYFVMTTKKHSLLTKKVLKKDYKDPNALLARKNVNQEKLLTYIKDTCDYCTDYQLPNTAFALNHHGQPDVALFDFTSMNAARSSVFVKEKNNPFWPTGSGCAKGFLGSLDACWAILHWSIGERSIYDIIVERENLYKLLPQVTNENLSKKFNQFSIDPSTRYSNQGTMFQGKKITNVYETLDEENGNFPPNIVQRTQFEVGIISEYISNCEILGLRPTKLLPPTDDKISYHMSSFLANIPKKSSLAMAIEKKAPDEKCAKAPYSKLSKKNASDQMRDLPQPLAFNKKVEETPRPIIQTTRSVRSKLEDPPEEIEDIDNLLERLESDKDFQNMTDNEQQTWMESLFYLDTKFQSHPLRHPMHKGLGIKNENGKVNTESLSERKKPLENQAMAASKAVSLNEKLIATAQSYFKSDNGPDIKKKIIPQQAQPSTTLVRPVLTDCNITPTRANPKDVQTSEEPDDIERQNKRMKLFGATFKKITDISRKRTYILLNMASFGLQHLLDSAPEGLAGGDNLRGIDGIIFFSDEKNWTVDRSYNKENDRCVASGRSTVSHIVTTKFPASIMTLGVVGSNGAVMLPFFFDPKERLVGNAKTVLMRNKNKLRFPKDWSGIRIYNDLTRIQMQERSEAIANCHSKNGQLPQNTKMNDVGGEENLAEDVPRAIRLILTVEGSPRLHGHCMHSELIEAGQTCPMP
eukprot:maker-scaffold374_size191929-snap-gene-0.34 protein:Tk01255 transcript:maker-scaffold374_size191929-snap-gene-0.34-mRNA-1 annotation:"mical"